MQSENTSGEILQAQYVKYFVSAQVSKDISGIVNTKKLSENKESKCKRELKFMRIMCKYYPSVIVNHCAPYFSAGVNSDRLFKHAIFLHASDARKQHVSLFSLVLLPVLTLPAFQILFPPLLHRSSLALSYPSQQCTHVLTYHSFTHSCGGCNRPIVIGMAPVNSAPIQLRLVHSNLTSK